MKILLVTTDLYKSIGGGRTVYKKIVEATPDIDFWYFSESEAEDASRPANAHPIRLLPRRNLRVLAPPPFASYRLYPLEEADRIARSVAGRSFDIVDTPDFYVFGSALRDAFAHHHVTVGRVVLAMHGNISKSIELNWGSAGNNALEQRMLEEAQFDAADGIYAISPRYMRKWQSVIDRAVCLIDAAHFVRTHIQDAPLEAAKSKTSLYCIGRSERQKGNDLFVELVRWLNRESFEMAAHIGDEDYSYQGISSGYMLRNIAAQRKIEIDVLPAMDGQQLGKLYAQRSIVVVPVRNDTLNLVALEALFSGCPVAVSNCAGVCDYLDESHPGLPYVKIDLENLYAAVADLQDLVDNYDRHRDALRSYLKTGSHFPQISLQMGAIYQSFLDTPVRKLARGENTSIAYEELGRTPKEQLVQLARRLLPTGTYRTLRNLAAMPKAFLVEKVRKSGYLGDAKFFGVLMDAQAVPGRLRGIAEHSESSTKRLREKLDAIYGNASNPLYRCNFWLDIARIERILGNELMAVTYELRILRLLGEDRLGLLPKVIDTLERHGFIHEAEVADAMYASSSQASEQVHAYLQAAYHRNLTLREKPFQILEDHRSREIPEVSVVVSLYKAADKLHFFLTALSQQTLVRQGRVEIVLIDSGSPTNEHGALEAFMREHPLSAVYARSAARETIQAAWNRGIGLARAPYLVFLGVDETLYPETLDVLAGELDHEPEIDWVMASSLVTAVDESGLHKNDIMAYDRTGATKDHTYLETCYLSWVGGMYRKSMHNRFGYYDETFGAAGDTEFKNRVLPHIRVKFVPQVLGLFLNYPDGQTTASTKAEIEDLRAWYVHRTPGGVRYAFETRPLEDARRLLELALGYRKSYCKHLSCDIEYAQNLAQHIDSRDSGLTVSTPLMTGLGKMLEQLRGLELAAIAPSRLDSMRVLISAWRTASEWQASHRKELGASSTPCYQVLNDNRYEQHSWLWRSN